MSFLSLPTELRFEIYGYIAVPYEAPLSTYAGLYLSCRQVKDELDSEGTKLLEAHLSETIADVEGLRLDFPVTGTLSTMQHVHLVVCDRVCSVRFHHLSSLFSLHLSSITISYLRQNGSPVWGTGKTTDLMYELQWWTPHVVNNPPCTRQIVIELPMLNRDKVETWLEYEEHYNILHYGWGFRWRAKSGGGVEGVWERECDVTERDEELEQRLVLRELRGLPDDDI